MTTAAALLLIAAPRSPVRVMAFATAGGLLMAHDWHDRASWFVPGPQDQPPRLRA
jgi:hypothetical protein